MAVLIGKGLIKGAIPVLDLSEILKAANSDICQVIKTTIYLSDIELWDRVNAVYSKFFGEHRPARSVVPTRDLHFGFQLEIEAVAVASKETA